VIPADRQPPDPADAPMQGFADIGGSEPVWGWCEQEVQQELPGLGLMCASVEVEVGSSLLGRSPAPVLGRLRELSNRWRGPRAVNLRQEPIPAAYRVFFRHIGLDPDVTRTPIEAAVLERMMDGGFLSEGWLADVLTVALVDTGIPVWAFDADRLSGPLGIRVSRSGERLGQGSDAPELGPGRLVVADAENPLALLFAGPAEGYEPTASTHKLLLVSIQVSGVPGLHVEEALWTCRAALRNPL
jgi:DNA/RNA-binding domain of Phe-tRNA-synthetase-like protein